MGLQLWLRGSLRCLCIGIMLNNVCLTNNAPVPLTILTSSDALLIPKMRKFQRPMSSDENLQCYHALNAMSTTRQA